MSKFPLAVIFKLSDEFRVNGNKLSPVIAETLVKPFPLISIGKFATFPAVKTWAKVEVGGKGGKF
jgi:hypothetical protein